MGSFVFGFDTKTRMFRADPRVYHERSSGCYPAEDSHSLSGTRLYKRLLSEGRLFARDWWLRGYPPDTLFFQPKGMTADELIRGYDA